MFEKYKQALVQKKLPRIVRLDKNLSPNSHRGSHDSSLQYRIDIGTGASRGCGRGQKVKKDERITPSRKKPN